MESSESVRPKGSLADSAERKRQKAKLEKKNSRLIREAEEEYGVEGAAWAATHEGDYSSAEEVEIESETDENALSEGGVSDDHALPPVDSKLKAGGPSAEGSEPVEADSVEGAPLLRQNSTDQNGESNPAGEPLRMNDGSKSKVRWMTGWDQDDKHDKSTEDMIDDLKQEVGDQPWLKSIEQFFRGGTSKRVKDGPSQHRVTNSNPTTSVTPNTPSPTPSPKEKPKAAAAPRKYRIFHRKKVPSAEVDTKARRGGSIIISAPSQFIQRTHVDFDYDWNVGEDPSKEFQLIQKLGAGAYGKVFKAKHRGTGFVLAIKTIPIQETNIEEAKKKQKELEVLKRCRSEYIVSYYGCALRRDNLWILMECCDRGSMADLIAVLKKPLPEQDISYILKQVLNGLNYLHSIKVIHRDIKSANILLTHKGELKLADFGTSGVVQSEAGMKTTVGTPVFMSPEVLDGEEGYGLEADIWSLGVTTIEIADRKPPFSDLSTMRAIREIVMGNNPNFADVTQWSEELRDIVNHCLNRDPKQRPHAEALLEHPFVKKNKANALSETFMAACRLLEKKQDPSELSPSGSLIMPGAPNKGPAFSASAAAAAPKPDGSKQSAGAGSSKLASSAINKPKTTEQKKEMRENLINNLTHKPQPPTSPGRGSGSAAIPPRAPSPTYGKKNSEPSLSPRGSDTRPSPVQQTQAELRNVLTFSAETRLERAKYEGCLNRESDGASSKVERRKTEGEKSRKSKSKIKTRKAEVVPEADPSAKEAEAYNGSSSKKRAGKKSAIVAPIPLAAVVPSSTSQSGKTTPRKKERDPATMSKSELQDEVVALRQELQKLKKKRRTDKDKLKALRLENKKLKGEGA